MKAMLQAEFAKQILLQTAQMRGKKRKRKTGSIKRNSVCNNCGFNTQLELNAKITKKLCQIFNTPQINIVLIYIMTSIPYM